MYRAVCRWASSVPQRSLRIVFAFTLNLEHKEIYLSDKVSRQTEFLESYSEFRLNTRFRPFVNFDSCLVAQFVYEVEHTDMSISCSDETFYSRKILNDDFFFRLLMPRKLAQLKVKDRIRRILHPFFFFFYNSNTVQFKCDIIATNTSTNLCTLL